MRERRKFKRFKALLDTEYTKVEGCTVINSLTTTKNISLSGLRVALGRMIKRGDDLLIELDLPSNNKRVAVLGKLIWIKPANRNNRNICGLKILWSSSQSLLKDCVGYARENQVAA